MNLTRNERRRLASDNRKWPAVLTRVPKAAWPESAPRLMVELWRSRSFLVQVHQEADGYERLSVCRTEHDGDSWRDGITWEELMQVKRECGRGHRDALEVYPADRDVVNVANMRHLWLPLAPVWFAWRKGDGR